MHAISIMLLQLFKEQFQKVEAKSVAQQCIMNSFPFFDIYRLNIYCDMHKCTDVPFLKTLCSFFSQDYITTNKGCNSCLKVILTFLGSKWMWAIVVHVAHPGALESFSSKLTVKLGGLVNCYIHFMNSLPWGCNSCLKLSLPFLAASGCEQ